MEKIVDVSDYLDNTIVEITTSEDGNRYVHFFGYGYRNYSDEINPCTFVEYTFFIVPLKDVLEIGFSKYEEKNQEKYKQYIENCTEERCKYIYEHYDNGEPPKSISENEIDKNVKDGTYILF